MTTEKIDTNPPPAPAPTDWSADYDIFDPGYIKNPFKVREGYIDLPTGPGLGIELDEEAMKDKIGHDWKNQESYDADDGSVVDW